MSSKISGKQLKISIIAVLIILYIAGFFLVSVTSMLSFSVAALLLGAGLICPVVKVKHDGEYVWRAIAAGALFFMCGLAALMPYVLKSRPAPESQELATLILPVIGYIYGMVAPMFLQKTSSGQAVAGFLCNNQYLGPVIRRFSA